MSDDVLTDSEIEQIEATFTAALSTGHFLLPKLLIGRMLYTLRAASTRSTHRGEVMGTLAEQLDKLIEDCVRPSAATDDAALLAELEAPRRLADFVTDNRQAIIFKLTEQ